jgi:hypothetical protein
MSPDKVAKAKQKKDEAKHKEKNGKLRTSAEFLLASASLAHLLLHEVSQFYRLAYPPTLPTGG